jgi:hypothetical protein
MWVVNFYNGRVEIIGKAEMRNLLEQTKVRVERQHSALFAPVSEETKSGKRSKRRVFGGSTDAFNSATSLIILTLLRCPQKHTFGFSIISDENYSVGVLVDTIDSSPTMLLRPGDRILALGRACGTDSFETGSLQNVVWEDVTSVKAIRDNVAKGTDFYCKVLRGLSSQISCQLQPPMDKENICENQENEAPLHQNIPRKKAKKSMFD